MLPLRRQLALVVIDAPTAARRLGARSATWLAIYIGAAALVLGLVATAIVRNRGALGDLVFDYVMPVEWRFAARLLVDKVLAQQEQVVLTNATIVLSLVAVQITLFPIKEQLSATLEHDARLVDEPVDEHPLWFQAWEEIKLFLAMLAAQGTIFWIGYADDPVRRRVAMVASFVVLFASIGVDFLSPVLQRHRLRYAAILKTLTAHPILVLGFGAVFAAPALAATAIAAGHPGWGFTTQLAVVFGAQVLGIALAAIGGTIAGASLIVDVRRRRPSHALARAGAWIVLLSLLAWNGYRFGLVGRSLHHKSQILKCRYVVDWASFRAELPDAMDLVTAVRSDALSVGVRFDVVITNPTSVDVEIERNRLEARQDGQLVARTALPEVRVAAGATERVAVVVAVTVTPSQALRLRELATTRGWAITLWLEVAGEFEFPIYLLADP